MWNKFFAINFFFSDVTLIVDPLLSGVKGPAVDERRAIGDCWAQGDRRVIGERCAEGEFWEATETVFVGTADIMMRFLVGGL